MDQKLCQKHGFFYVKSINRRPL